jgi:lysophospholipase
MKKLLLIFSILMCTGFSYPLAIFTLKTPDGKTLRVGHWQAPSSSQPVVLVQGRGNYIEHFEELAQLLTEQGFNVWTFDFRGQGGSSRNGFDPMVSHVEYFDDYTKDLKVFFDQVVKEKNVPVIALSMGAAITLRFIHDYPGYINKLIALSPMIRINTAPYPYYLSKILAYLMVWVGKKNDYTLGSGPYNFKDCEKDYDPVKFGDQNKWNRLCEFSKHYPQLMVGGPSWQWLKEAFASSEDLLEKNYVEKINIPLLVIHPENDYRIGSDSQRQFCLLAPDCKLKTYPKIPHDLILSTPEEFKKIWMDIFNFLKPVQGQ